MDKLHRRYCVLKLEKNYQFDFFFLNQDNIQLGIISMYYKFCQFNFQEYKKLCVDFYKGIVGRKSSWYEKVIKFSFDTSFDHIHKKKN